jgi:RimJ/RimL family protein N-acetyltransferase
MITIRESKVTDAKNIAACIQQVCRERKYLANTDGFSVEQTAAFIKSLSENGGIQLICVDIDKVVGWCDIVPGSFEGFYQTGYLGMGLLENYRSQGLGIKLLDEIIEMAFRRSFERIELEVFSTNIPAINLYKRFGFKQEGIKRRARKLDNQYDDIMIFGLLKNEWRTLD